MSLALRLTDLAVAVATDIKGYFVSLQRTTLQLVPKNRRIALLGDSIVAQNSDPTVGTENYGFLSQALRLADQRFTFDLTHNFGWGGDNTFQMRARVQAVIDSGAGTCIVAGGTNDRTSGLSAADTIANLTWIRDQLNAAGIFVIMMTPAPRGDTAFPDKALAGAALGDHLTVRKWILNQGLNYATVVVDLWTTLADPASTTAGIKLNYTRDGLHPLPLGAYYWGKPLAVAMCQVVDKDLSLLPATNSDTFDAVTNPGGNVTVNPLFQGTAGVPAAGGSGVLGDGWGGTNAGAAAGVTRVYSKVTTPTGDWQQVVIGGTAPTGTAAVDIFRQIGLQNNVIVGQQYEAVGEFEIDAGSVNFLSLQLGIVATGPGGTVTLWDGDRYNDTGTLNAEAQAGTFRSPRITIPAGVTDVRLRLASYMGAVGAPAAVIRVRKVAIIPARDTVPTGRRESFAAEIKQLFAALSTKVDIVAGKTLSTNDYTTVDKDKLAALRMPGYETQVTVAAATGITTCNLALGTIFELNMTGNVTIALSNIPVPMPGQSFTFTIRLIQHATTKFSLTWPAGLTFLNTGGLPGDSPAPSKIIEYVVSTTTGTTAYVRKGASN